MPPVPKPRVRYHLLAPLGDRKVPVVLDAEDVVAWVTGFATAIGQRERLDVIEPGPEDTRRVQALQVGDELGWFEFLYPEYPDRAEG